MLHLLPARRGWTQVKEVPGQRTRCRRAREPQSSTRGRRTVGSDKPLWGAPWIHGELRKLGIVVSQSTVARPFGGMKRLDTWSTIAITRSPVGLSARSPGVNPMAVSKCLGPITVQL